MMINFLISLLLVGLASAVAFSPLQPAEQSVLVFVFALLALILAGNFRNAPIRKRTVRAPIGESLPEPITRHSEFPAFLNGLSDPVMVMRGDIVVEANEAARKLLGKHIVGEDIRLAVRHPAAVDLLTRSDEQMEGRPIQLIGIGSRDQRWEMRTHKLPHDERIVFLWDRTGFYAAERMRTDFVANASHELRTPLASIIGFLETLSDEEAGADPALRTRFLNVMQREAARMQRLIDDLISLSRIEAEKFRLPDMVVDLPGLMREVQTVCRRSSPERGADIELDIAEHLPAIQGDTTQMSQLLHNLVSNSMKYGQVGTPIRLSLSTGRAGQLVRLRVSDRGEGIAPEHLPRLTERFYRVDSSRSKAIGGTGLGLSIVKHIVERHRGRIEIDSQLNHGTTITITLPAVAAEEEEKEDRGEQPEQQEGKSSL